MDFLRDHSLDPALQSPPVMPARGGAEMPPAPAVPPRSFMHGIFISKPRGGFVYVARRSHRSVKLIWHRANHPNGPCICLNANKVPRSIRYQAYRWLRKSDR